MKMHAYLFILLIICLFALTNCAPYNLKIEISATELKQSLEKYFPLFLPGLDYVTVLDSPEITLVKDNVQLNTRLMIPGELAQQPMGDAILNATPVYNHDDLTFYLKNIQLLEIKSNSLDEAKKQAAREAINKLLGSKFREIPVYKLNQHDFKTDLVAYILRDVAAVKDKLMLTLALPGK